MATYKLTQVSKGDEFLPQVRDHRPKLYLFKVNIGNTVARPDSADILEICNLLPNHEIGRCVVENSAALSGTYNLAVVKGDPGSAVTATNARATDVALISDVHTNGRSNGTDNFASFRTSADRDKTLSVAIVCDGDASADIASGTETIIGVEIYEREEIA